MHEDKYIKVSMIRDKLNKDELKGCAFISKAYKDGMNKILRIIDRLPALEVKHVVYCKNCKYMNIENNNNYCTYFNKTIKGNDWCSNAKLKKGNNNDR